MNQLLVGPLLVLFLSGFTLELSNIAEHTSQKVLDFSQQMDGALDCALAGVDIRVCSPQLLRTDFKPDLQTLEEVNANLTTALRN